MGVIEVDGDLQAQAAGVDVSRVSEEALVLALDVRRKQVIREEIRQNLEALERMQRSRVTGAFCCFQFFRRRN